MNRSQIVTLRMPKELKKRLEEEAQYQGVSLNQLTNYLLTVQLTQLERQSLLERRLSKKNLGSLKARFREIMDKTPDREVPDWDTMPHSQ